MTNWRSDRIGACVRGQNPTAMVRMPSGFAVLGDSQFLPGYCVLLAYPQVPSLNALSLPDRRQYLGDMTLVADAIIEVCAPARINYQTLTNLDHFLHTHIEPRYDWEPGQYRHGPSYFYPAERRGAQEYVYCPRHYGELKDRITQALKRLMKDAE